MANLPEAWFLCTLGDDALRLRRMRGYDGSAGLPEYRIELARMQRLEPVAPTNCWARRRA
jgi:hypothetical protein